MTDDLPQPVLFILPSLMPGGAERVMINLMNGIDRSRFTPALAVLYPGGPLRALLSLDVDVDDLHHRGPIPASVFALYRVIAGRRPKIIVSTMAPMNFTVLLLRLLFPRTRFIVREAISPSYFFAHRPLLAPLLRCAYRWLYALADKVICPSQSIMDEFITGLHMKAERLVLLPNPVDIARIRGYGVAPRRSTGLTLIASGRLHPQKGFDLLIAALKDFRTDDDWHLTILGEGPQRPALEKMIADAALDDHIHLAGLVETPWPHYAAADAFILSSRWEGMPNVVLEALACGTPVFALSGISGIPDIAAATPGAVTAVDIVEDLVGMLARLKPSPTESLRPSLLPPAFEKTSVDRDFMTLLDAVAGNGA